MSKKKRTVYVVTHPSVPGACAILGEYEFTAVRIPDGSVLTKSTMFENIWDFVDAVRDGCER